MSKGKNGNELVKQFSLPPTQLDLMEPTVCLVSTKLDFVTIFTDICDANMWVYDSFRFRPEKNIPTSFVFILWKSAFPIGLAFFVLVLKNVPVFFCRIWAGITAFLRKIEAVNLNSQ